MTTDFLADGHLCAKRSAITFAEVHRERAAHMVAIRQSAAHLKDHRQGGSTMPPLVSESPTTFLQHYVPKTPGAEAMPLTPLIGYAAAVADASLFVPGAVQHGDVMKLVTAAGQSVLDNLPSPPLPAITSPSSVRRMRISQEGSGPCFGGAAGGGGGNRSYSGSVPLGYQQTSKLPSREFQQLRDQPTSNQRKQSPPSLQAQQQQQQQLQPHHVTTVVAQPVAIPRTRMRVPSPGMARELGLEVPPPPPSQQTSASALDRVSSLGLLPDPAGGKSRNGRPRAPHRTQLGLPFAGNVAMLVLENHSDLVKVVSSVPSTLDCVATLRQVTNMPSNVSYCDDDGQCDDGSYGSSIAEVSNQSRDGVGHRVMVFAAQPVGPSAASTTSSPPAVSAIASSPQTPSLEGNSINIDSVHGTGLSSILTTPDTTGATDTGYGAAVTHGSDSAGRIATSPIRGTNSDASGGDGEGRLSPFSSMPAALNAIGYEEYFNRSNGGVSSDGADISSGIGGVSELSWRSRQPYAGTSSPLSHVEPLTLAASQSVLQMQNSMASLGGGGGGGGGGGNGSSGTPGASSGVFSAATTSQQPLITTPSGRSAAALLSTASIPLAAGQLHVPLTSVYRRMAPAPGAAGTAGAMLTPVLAATAVVQPAVSAETAKLCASRLTTVMSTGPMAEAAEPNAGSFGGATEAGNAAAGARACAATARLSSPSSLPPSTSSSFTRDYSYTRYGSPAPNCGDVIDASPLRSPPLMATPSQDNVVLLPRMVVYETALLDATAAVGSGSSPASPRSGAASGGGPTVRLASLGPVAASAAAAAASSTVPAGAGGGAATNGHSPTHILPALPGSAVAAVAAAAAVTGVGAGASPAAATAAGGGGGGGGMSSSPPGSPRLRPPPRMLRSMDASLPYQYGASRELLGYFSSGPRLAPEFDDAGMIFTGGIGGRPVRYGSPGGQRRGPGAGNGGSAAAARRIGGVSLRDLAGVNGIYRDENRNPMGRNAASQRAQEGPDLPLELDADAPPLQNRKLSEPSLDDLKYILTRWSKRWSQERNLVGCPVIGGPGLESCTSVSEPGSPLRQTATNDLLRYGYTSDDLYRMAKEQHQQQQQQLQQQQHQNHDVVGVGAFKRPLTQLDLFGLPYIGGTPRVVDRRPDPISSGVGGVGGVGGVHSSQLNERSVSSNRRAKLQG
ncbi:hypothetical protein Vretimale_5229 [Volvox reticuliferus]|uniref:Uncharacterized protein n=1 Tax=Volvox reticuliferus TaxID=1737510 RepID=A0A8J4G5N1_9CHLO|nr:hypothetical protein Vretimale_5229 [Volvox reticuliferus]